MWRNFLVVTIRSIRKNKLFNLINIAGLAIGLACAIFILLYVISESSYDRFNERGEDIYRICLDGKMAGEEIQNAYTSPVTGPVFTTEIPEVLKDTIFLEDNLNEVVLLSEKDVGFNRSYSIPDHFIIAGP